jgi:hypothetical protein
MAIKFSELPSQTSVTGSLALVAVDVGPENFTATVDNVRNYMFTDPTFTGTVSGVTATHVGLGNVTNESKATMFTSPVFTGTTTGITSAMVGLGNVTNESKATMFASPTFTGTVSGITAAMVGLGNVANESKATLFTSPIFTGTPTSTTAIAGTNNTQIATTEFVSTAVSNLVSAAPTTLDTLNELAAALGNDANFSTTITNALGLKAPTTNPTFSGTVAMGAYTATSGTINVNNTGFSLTVTGNQNSVGSRVVNASEGATHNANLLVSSGTTNPVQASLVSTHSTSVASLDIANANFYLRGATSNRDIFIAVNNNQDAIKVTGSDKSVIVYSENASTSTISGALQVVGGVGVQGQIFTSALTVQGLTSLQQYTESINTKTSATGTVDHDYSTGTIFLHTNIFNDFTANFTNVPTTTNKSITFKLVLVQGATPYMANAVQIDSVPQTINWLNSTPPTGNSAKRDVVVFTLLRSGSTWTVLANIDSFGV